MNLRGIIMKVGIRFDYKFDKWGEGREKISKIGCKVLSLGYCKISVVFEVGGEKLRLWELDSV